jgi:hypothetical protein
VLQHNDQVKISIGDVTGHGLESGVLTIMVQTAMRTLLEHNETDTQAVRKFQAFIEELVTSDPSELYIRHLEENAQDESDRQSGLGLLTMMNDYLAKLGWKFETVQKNPEVLALTTMVQLTV